MNLRTVCIRTRRVYRCAAIALMTATVLAVSQTANAISVFTGASGGISFGVANIAGPVGAGVPTYLLNNFNGRTDILLNPGIGQSAYATVANNTTSTGVVNWGPGQYIFNVQNGGGNINGAFGSGAAAIVGGQFGYRLADGGIPGGFSASYEIMSWNASFTQVGAAPIGTTGTYITMGGFLPANQDLALVSLRTRLVGNTIGLVEVPGLVLAVERGPGNTYSTIALQDNVNGGAGATAMPGGWATIIDNAVTGKFRALAYNVFPDLGAIDGLSIPNGEIFTAQVTASVFADPASVEMFSPLDPINADLLALALNSSGTPTPFPATPLLDIQNPDNVPEPAAIALALIGSIPLWRRRR
jgi:hypothetical protein